MVALVIARTPALKIRTDHWSELHEDRLLTLLSYDSDGSAIAVDSISLQGNTEHEPTLLLNSARSIKGLKTARVDVLYEMGLLLLKPLSPCMHFDHEVWDALVRECEHQVNTQNSTLNSQLQDAQFLPHDLNEDLSVVVSDTHPEPALQARPLSIKDSLSL